MTKSAELVLRAKDRLEELGIKMQETSFYGLTYISEREWIVGYKYIMIYETPRRNGTNEDVTATIEVLVVTNTNGCSSRIAKFKIPTTASDKVINNRIQKALAEIN